MNDAPWDEEFEAGKRAHAMARQKFGRMHSQIEEEMVDAREAGMERPGDAPVSDAIDDYHLAMLRDLKEARGHYRRVRIMMELSRRGAEAAGDGFQVQAHARAIANMDELIRLLSDDIEGMQYFREHGGAVIVEYLYRLPAEIPAGTVLVHNHVRRARRLGSRGFRAWLENPRSGLSRDRLERCPCGWAPELGPHYRVARGG
jgi:hypothetical protein